MSGLGILGLGQRMLCRLLGISQDKAVGRSGLAKGSFSINCVFT